MNYFDVILKQKTQSKIILAIFLSTCLSSQKSWSAACCSGASQGPSIIVGDEKIRMQASHTHSYLKTDVGSDGVWRDRTAYEKVQNLKLDFSHIFYDRYQAGFSTQFSKKTYFENSSSGIGDSTAFIAYEAVTNWDFHLYKPKVFIYSSLGMPTAKSTFESTEEDFLDSRGRGFWSLTLGSLLSKNIFQYDLLLDLAIHKEFEKNVTIENSSTRLEPGYGASLSLGGGYNYKDYRFGILANWTYEDPIQSTTSFNQTEKALQRQGSLSLIVSRYFVGDWTLAASIASQKIIGSPSNVSLGDTYMISLSKTYPR